MRTEGERWCRVGRDARSLPDSMKDVSGAIRMVRGIISGVRSIPCQVQGRIIGRGVPGLFYSEDLVLQDSSGFITLDYRQPLRLLEFLSGAFRVQEFIGKDAIATGWYRRSPRPYLELRYLIPHGGARQTTYAYPTKLAVGAVLTGLGILALLPLIIR